MKKAYPLKVQNISFLMEQATAACGKHQYLREFTQNSIEAGATEIIWDYVELGGVRKLRISDNGCGMSKEELSLYMNSIYSSSKTQGVDANFGVGAKISSLAQNPEGVMIHTWKEGAGQGIVLGIVDGVYGAVVHNEEESPVYDLEDDLKPSITGSHGTSVTFLGKSRSDQTFQPEGATNLWMASFLNQKYYSLPDSVTIRVRETSNRRDSSRDSDSRRIHGMLAYHSKVSSAQGIAEFDNFRVHWFIKEEKESRIGSEYGSRCRVAALHKGELHEAKFGRAINSTLNNFGIYFAPTRISLYVESKIGHYPNAYRTFLVKGGEGIPWEDWGREFASNLPEEIKEVEREAANKSQVHSQNDLMSIFNDNMDLFLNSSSSSRVGKRENSGGEGDDTTSDGSSPTLRRGNNPKKPPMSQLYGGRKANKKSTQSIEPPSLNRVGKDYGGDVAATYIEANNSIMLNVDYISYAIVIDRLVKERGAELEEAIKASVFDAAHCLLSQSIVVSKSMPAAIREESWSAGALTAVVSVRHTLMTMASKLIKKKVKELEALSDTEKPPL